MASRNTLLVSLALLSTLALATVQGRTKCESEYDYIVVGSGAGGGPLASRLALAGYKTLLIEAGPDYISPNITIPASSLSATEDPNISWDYFIKQFPESTGQRQHVWYPRVGGLGGCTIHNAMIGMYPHVSDFNNIAQELDDQSWTNQNMRKYFNRLKKNERESPDENVGWASFSFLDIVSGFRSGDLQLMNLFKNLITSILPTPGGDVNGGASEDSLYPNRHAGWHLPPQNIDKENGYVRSSVRDFIKYAVQKAPQSLTVWTETLVTKVLIDDGNTATGVEYMKGANLYKASPLHKNHGSNKRAVYAKREIIISGGAFNTPQLLMLSGIGDPHQLKKWDIPVKSGLVGVGKNLQDHQEISLNLQMQYPHKDLAECRNSANPLENPCFVAYAEKHTGPYAASGAIFGISTKTSKELEEPNVYILGAVAMFYGYHQGYSIEAGNSTDKVSFVMLKGHTKNNNGYVQLRSSDPTDVPDINFLFWSDGDDDIRDNAKQLKWMRKQFEQGPLNKQYVKKELLPGLNANVEEYVRHNSWGHHACCTAKMGSKDDPLAVLDNQLRVYGIQGLRVVDASIFPKIPGFFVTVPIEMVSEKAADMIIEQANKESDRCTLRSSEYTV